MFVFTFLAKIYKSYTEEHKDQLQSFKKLIYESDLDASLTTCQGIESKQLFKFFAQKINDLQVSDKAEESLINLINNSRFFEDIIFNAIRNKTKINQDSDAQTKIEALKEFFES